MRHWVVVYRGETLADADVLCVTMDSEVVATAVAADLARRVLKPRNQSSRSTRHQHAKTPDGRRAEGRSL